MGASTQRQALLRWALSGSGKVRPSVVAKLGLARPVRRIGCIGTICVVHFNPKAKRRPGHLKRPTTTAIRPCIEISRPKRRNGAAYLHRHRRSRTGGHAIITNGRHMGYRCSRTMLVTHWIAGTACTSWSDRASLTRKRAGNAISRSKKANQEGGRGNRTRVTPLHTGLLSDSYRTQTQNPRRHPRRPGMAPKPKTHVGTHVAPGCAPRRHPHLRETP